MKVVGRANVEMVVRALPHTIQIGTVCSGSGMVELVLDAVVNELNTQFGTSIQAGACDNE